MKWGKTLISGSATNPVAGGAVSIQVRLQHDFKAKDITFTETTQGGGSTVTSIFFGDRLVWSNTAGIGIGVFATTGFLRGLLEGQTISKGLDIVIAGNVGAAGDTLTAALVGEKPVKAC